MNLKSSILLKIIGVFILIIISGSLSGQNSELNKTVSITIVNKRFEVALKQIQEKFNLNLSYNSEIIPKNKVVSVNATNNRLDKILAALLASENLQMLVVNDQIIIVRANPLATEIKSYNPPKLDETNPGKTEISGNIITVVDTVMHTIHDTIVSKIYDTIRITVYDTKFIRQQSNFPGISWDPKFAVNISSSMIYELSNSVQFLNSEQQVFFQQYGIAEKSRLGYSLAGGVSLRNKRIEIAAGVEVLNIYTDIPVMNLPQNFFKTTQIIVSTTISQDGIYYEYRTDTTWHDVNYNPNQAVVKNSYTFLSLPVIISYKCIQTKTLAFGINFGVGYSKLLNAKGLEATLSNGDILLKNGKGESLSVENFSYITGMEIEYPLTKKIFLISSLQYRFSNNSMYKKSFPISEKPSYIYPSLSIKYSL